MKTSYLYVTTIRIACIIWACSMIGYWVYKFHVNKDVTLIEFKATKAVIYDILDIWHQIIIKKEIMR